MQYIAMDTKDMPETKVNKEVIKTLVRIPENEDIENKIKEFNSLLASGASETELKAVADEISNLAVNVDDDIVKSIERGFGIYDDTPLYIPRNIRLSVRKFGKETEISYIEIFHNASKESMKNSEEMLRTGFKLLATATGDDVSITTKHAKKKQYIKMSVFTKNPFLWMVALTNELAVQALSYADNKEEQLGTILQLIENQLRHFVKKKIIGDGDENN
jgi:hypothetical protein